MAASRHSLSGPRDGDRRFLRTACRTRSISVRSIWRLASAIRSADGARQAPSMAWIAAASFGPSVAGKCGRLRSNRSM